MQRHVHDGLILRLYKSDKELRALKSELKGLKSTMSAKEADLQDAQEELDRLRSETREKDKTLRKETREMESLKEEVATLQARLKPHLKSFLASLAYPSSIGGEPGTSGEECAYLGQSSCLSPASQRSRHAR